MGATEQLPSSPATRTRWYRITPHRCLEILLILECLLFALGYFPLRYSELHAFAIVLALFLAVVMFVFLAGWFLLSRFFRWRFQFGLISLLLLAAVVAVPAGWMRAFYLQESRETQIESEIMERVTAAGGKRSAGMGPGLFDTGIRVTGISFFDSEITDDELAGLVPELKKIRWLRSLDFLGTPITDKSLETLAAEMPHIESLDLSETAVTDEGIRYLEGFHQLSYLDIAGTQVTDRSIPQLLKLSSLRYLRLSSMRGESEFSDEGIEELQRGLPDCNVY